ncbi:related to COT1 - Vacuolar zinc (and possibly other metals) transporter [Melanopsichium pennsylvanicum]|uniref:Related to COT1 - Vacuolar zinc (And possibly other metals) transporter n=2 Tax=Melanopsichium pennsylvanicum TaxID=63383 RepID=A0AAJ5C4L5_9BASI|nr:related to COT1-Vacuolar zinc (and possibly other metals) transporter [Melanopsichium pennsylvanicum 4]SNX83792.1 related to COT1 - Vacuolar zinc (and possibly other metals) transporter [Melanopsichium pennsylvanicum]
MGLSKETRIITLLVIDVVFFFIEIITGYAVGSLALVADSFHMLNDVMSLVVALWAVKLSTKSSDHRFSYGWQRAEVLGALVNGVFLLALCFSIFMEAIQRFVNVTEVSNPKLVVIVGCLGLASNLVGLLLFHDHGHAHGGHAHSHGHASHTHAIHDNDHSHAVTHADSHSHAHNEYAVSDTVTPVSVGGRNKTSGSIANDETITKRSRGRQDSVGSILGHPAQTRAFVVQTAHDLGYDGASSSRHQHSNSVTSINAAERTRLLTNASNDYGATDVTIDLENGSSSPASKNNHNNGALDPHNAPGHAHSHAPGGGAAAGDHGHSHGEGSMNMRGVFLHVLGDALGNVGVIAAGLFIMYSDAWWRFYSDPAISFLITIIIFHSALPLCKSASYILLQGVPASVSLEAVRHSIQSVDGVLNLHELHVWQLSESKIVASVHVLVDCSSGQTEKYMNIAAQIRANLHSWGIHSSTIQPEFVPGGLREAAILSGVQVAESDEHGRLRTVEGRLVENEVQKVDTACLIACGKDNDCQTESCCPPGQTSKAGSGSVTPATAGNERP